MTMPNFIIIGAPRAGATSLYHYLRQHPHVVMSRIKETLFFGYLASQTITDYKISPTISWPIKNLKEYQALFESKEKTKAIGEASPLYLFTPGVPEQIKTFIPDVKLVIILRNPIERAYSSHLKNLREGIETRSFEDAIHKEINDPGIIVESQAYYIRAGWYYQHLTRYLKHFDRSQLRIDYFENLINKPLKLLVNIFHALEVDTDFVPDVSVKFNKAMPSLIKRTTNRQKIKSITRRIRKMIPQGLYFRLLNFQYRVNAGIASYPLLMRETRLLLRDPFIEDVASLEQLLQRDLSHWLAVE